MRASETDRERYRAGVFISRVFFEMSLIIFGSISAEWSVFLGEKNLFQTRALNFKLSACASEQAIVTAKLDVS